VHEDLTLFGTDQIDAPPFRIALTDHLSWMRLRDFARGSVSQRRYALLRFERALDGLDPLKATDADLERWAHSIERLASNTRSTEIGHIAQFYKWTVKRHLIARDPTLELMRPRRKKGLPRPIAEADLLIAIANAGRDVRMWFLLAAWGGLRAGDIAYLQREEILDTAKPPVMRITGKGGRTRLIPIGPALLMELHAFGLPTRGYVFKRMDGKPGCNSAARLSQRANRVLHELGIAATLHQLRHRYGTQLYAVSQDLRMVQEVMGHNDPLTTAGYVAYSPAAAAAAAEKLDEELLNLVHPNQTTLLSGS
jgi:integrase/recombinase XerC